MFNKTNTVKPEFYSYRLLLWLWDVATLNLLFLLLSVFVTRAEAFRGSDYYQYFLAMNLCWMAATFLSGLYFSNDWMDIGEFVKDTLKGYVFALLLVLLFVFLSKKDYSRLFLSLSFIGFALLLILNRFIYFFVVEGLKKNGKFRKNAIVLGYNDISKRLIGYASNKGLINVVGVFDDRFDDPSFQEIRLSGSLKDSVAYAIEKDVTEIYSTISPESNPYLYELAKRAESYFIHFKFIPDYRVFVNRNIFIDFLADIPVISLRNHPLENGGNKMKKRIFDIVFSLLVIILLLSWLIPLVAILIKLNSKGPVFFIQERSGKNNEPFKCLKFRTLRMNDEANSKQVTKGDNRITALGKFLRKSNIDELPQFLNVFMGDMSVVGPRPHMLRHTNDFTDIYKQYMIRHFVKPGVTGWAQVNGFRGVISEDTHLVKRIEHDIWYMENWSISLDLKIIFMTVYNTVKGDENAF
jgi:putative colanic acid biosynthesis UDP-glucose lipid carrier transferase